MLKKDIKVCGRSDSWSSYWVYRMTLNSLSNVYGLLQKQSIKCILNDLFVDHVFQVLKQNKTQVELVGWYFNYHYIVSTTTESDYLQHQCQTLVKWFGHAWRRLWLAPNHCGFLPILMTIQKLEADSLIQRTMGEKRCLVSIFNHTDDDKLLELRIAR